MRQGITTFSQHFTTQMSPHYPQLEPIYYESRAKNGFFVSSVSARKLKCPNMAQLETFIARLDSNSSQYYLLMYNFSVPVY